MPNCCYVTHCCGPVLLIPGPVRGVMPEEPDAGTPHVRVCGGLGGNAQAYPEDYLFVHVRRSGSRKVLFAMTNNIEEGLARSVKRQCRRLPGRGHLSRDIEAFSPATPPLMNLRNPNYCQTVYGGQEPEKIAGRFSAVDPKKPAQLLKEWREDRAAAKMRGKLAGLKNLPKQVGRFLLVAAKAL